MSGKEKPIKKTKYQRILSRADGKRPAFFKEIERMYGIGPSKTPDCLVMKLELLTPAGNKITVTWSEKDANESNQKRQ